MTREQLAGVLEEERRRVTDGINTAYWAFTRMARGSPPPVTVPHLYARRNELSRRLLLLRRSSATT